MQRNAAWVLSPSGGELSMHLVTVEFRLDVEVGNPIQFCAAFRYAAQLSGRRSAVGRETGVRSVIEEAPSRW